LLILIALLTGAENVHIIGFFGHSLWLEMTFGRQVNDNVHFIAKND